MPAQRAVVMVMFGRSSVIVAGFDGLRGQNVIEGLRIRVFVDPGANGGEHGFVDLDVFVAKGGVMKSTEDVVHYFVNGDSGVFPGVEDTAGWGNRLVDVEFWSFDGGKAISGLTGLHIARLMRRLCRRMSLGRWRNGLWRAWSGLDLCSVDRSMAHTESWH